LSNVLSLIGEDVDTMRGCTEELVYVERADGLALEGAIIRPGEGARTAEVAATAVILVHGNTSRFYDQPYIELGRELAQQGYTFITANTHGHDVASVIWGPEGEATPGGACWERFDEVPLDLDAGPVSPPISALSASCLWDTASGRIRWSTTRPSVEIPVSWAS
jgi:hypothetical protein